jgi:predicted dehydrogenase
MKNWKIGIVKDTSKQILGLHGHHLAFLGLPGVEISALVESNTEDLQQKMEQVKAKRHYLTIAEMLEKEELDIVVITSRHPHEHLEQIRMVAEKGCHIHCEKPLSADLNEADEIVEIVEKNKIKLCMAHPSRYGLGILTMKKMVEAGEIGDPMTIYSRGKNDHRGGGEDLMVLGTHVLDIQSFFFGSPEYIMADVAQNGKPLVKTDRLETVEPLGLTAGDEIFAYYRYPGGVRGILESKRGYFDKSENTIHMGTTVIGTKGALSMRFCDGNMPEAKLMISRTPGPLEANACFEEVPLTEERIIPGAEPLDYSLQKFAAGAAWFFESNRYAAWDLMCAIEEDRLPVSNVYNGRLTLEMIYGIYASSLSRSVVNFPLTERIHPLII